MTVTPISANIPGVIEAHEAVIEAAIEVLSAERIRPDDPHGDDQAGYAADQLALAARDLVRAYNHAPEKERPVGW